MLKTLLALSPWLWLSLGVLLEISATLLATKGGEGMPKLYILAFLSAVVSMAFAAMALRELPPSIVYTIWTGAGIALVTTASIALGIESFSWLKIFFISLILIGGAGLKYLT